MKEHILQYETILTCLMLSSKTWSFDLAFIDIFLSTPSAVWQPTLSLLIAKCPMRHTAILVENCCSETHVELLRVDFFQKKKIKKRLLLGCIPFNLFSHFILMRQEGGVGHTSFVSKAESKKNRLLSWETNWKQIPLFFPSYQFPVFENALGRMYLKWNEEEGGWVLGANHLGRWWRGLSSGEVQWMVGSCWP